jgi:hypothetical protein
VAVLITATWLNPPGPVLGVLGPVTAAQTAVPSTVAAMPCGYAPTVTWVVWLVAVLIPAGFHERWSAWRRRSQAAARRSHDARRLRGS